MSQCSSAGGSGRVGYKMVPSLPDCPVNCQCLWKKTHIEKKVNLCVATLEHYHLMCSSISKTRKGMKKCYVEN